MKDSLSNEPSKPNQATPPIIAGRPWQRTCAADPCRLPAQPRQDPSQDCRYTTMSTPRRPISFSSCLLTEPQPFLR